MVLKRLFCVFQNVTTALEEEKKGKEEIAKGGRNYPRFIEPGICGRRALEFCKDRGQLTW